MSSRGQNVMDEENLLFSGSTINLKQGGLGARLLFKCPAMKLPPVQNAG